MSQQGAAIALALPIPDSLLLVDDREAAAAARSAGLNTLGTLGFLYRADREGLTNFPDAVTRLRATNFRVPVAQLDMLLLRHRLARDAP